ncbi:MAG: hypothetical protein AAGJ80_16780, partial [Cyanobacteria bacterium J06553_1]
MIAFLKSKRAPSPAVLFTLDVAALYTNIPIDEGISAVAESFLRNPDPERPDLSLLTLLRIILCSNVFEYKGSSWLQLHGVAMGQVFGGSFANIFMGRWEHRALQS